MISQLSQVYFQTYQLAYDTAKVAERALQHELGDPNATFVDFGYWDSLRKGLLSGERLSYDLQRMERSYLDLNKREYELTKHVSLAVTDPSALIAPAHDRRVLRRAARGALRPRPPGPVPAPAQDGERDDPVRRRAVHEHQLHADAVAQLGPHEQRPGARVRPDRR